MMECFSDIYAVIWKTGTNQKMNLINNFCPI